MNMLTDPKNHRVRDMFFIVCDDLKGPTRQRQRHPPQTIGQARVTHLIRATLHDASRKY